MIFVLINITHIQQTVISGESIMKKIKVPNTRLFQGMAPDEIQGMLKCLSAVQKEYKKDDYIFRMGESITSVGLVLKGSVYIIQEDFWGERHILSDCREGQLFGESYACVQSESLMVSVIASENSEILFLDVNRVLTICSSACVFHSRLIRNLLSVISEKNLLLTRKIDHMSRKTIREKLMAYLSFQATRHGNRTFEIPFNRQQLADYLSVDRSALSAELSKMQKDGLLSYQKNRFTL